MASAPPYDCLIIGGGPAGAALALLAAGDGHRTALIDRGDPRRGIPEEVLAARAEALLKRLGVFAIIRAHEFIGGRDLVQVWGDGRAQRRRQSMAERGFQVQRAVFDADLRTMAKSLGAEVFEHAVARSELPRLGSGDVEVLIDGAPRTIAARVIVVAMGKSVDGRLLPLSRVRSLPPLTALSTVIKGPRRGASVIEALPMGWFWRLPLKSCGTSLTLFADPDDVRRRGRDRVFAAALAASGDRRLPNNLRPDFEASATPRLLRADAPLLLIGDAAATADPIAASGLESALLSAEDAAIAVNTMLRYPELKDAVLRHHARLEERRFMEHARDALRRYAAEVRFSDCLFWAKRHETAVFHAAPGLPEGLIVRAPGVTRRPLLKRRGRVYRSELVWSTAEDVAASSADEKLTEAILECLDEPRDSAAIQAALAARPEFAQRAQRDIESALRDLFALGMIQRHGDSDERLDSLPEDPEQDDPGGDGV